MVTSITIHPRDCLGKYKSLGRVGLMSWQRIRDSLRDIAADRLRGARELVIECARMLSARLSEVQPAVFESATQLELRELARWVISTQPEMAPFYHLGAVIMGEGAGAGAVSRSSPYAWVNSSGGWRLSQTPLSRQS